MPAHTLFQEWRASNESNKYPFSDAASLTNDQGDFIADNTFIDAVLYPIGGGPRLRLSVIEVDFPFATFYIGDSVTERLASGTIDLWEAPDNVLLQDTLERTAGMLVSDATRLSVFQSWAIGTHTFTAEETEFVAMCCMPMPEAGVRGILLETGELLTNDVVLLGDSGIVLRKDTFSFAQPCEDSQTVDVIRVDIVGDPLSKRRNCEPMGQFVTPRFIRQLTFKFGANSFVCIPGEFGGIVVAAGNKDAEDSILRVRTLSDRIVIEAVGSSIRGS